MPYRSRAISRRRRSTQAGVVLALPPLSLATSLRAQIDSAIPLAVRCIGSLRPTYSPVPLSRHPAAGSPYPTPSHYIPSFPALCPRYGYRGTSACPLFVVGRAWRGGKMSLHAPGSVASTMPKSAGGMLYVCVSIYRDIDMWAHPVPGVLGPQKKAAAPVPPGARALLCVY